MNRKIIDRLVATKNRLNDRHSNLLNYFDDNLAYPPASLTAADIDRAVARREADEIVLHIVCAELDVLDQHYSTAEILQARHWYDGLSVAELFDSYSCHLGEYGCRSFNDWLVNAAHESWFCQTYDC